ncbi:MAG: porin family protein [Bacteroidota bacterium]
MKNMQFYDEDIIHFGFALGVNKTDFAIQHADNFYSFDSLYSVENIGLSGFNIGIVSDLRMGNYLNLRFVPTISFATRQITYQFVSKTQSFSSTKEIESTFIYLPFAIKYKSQRHNNYRVYVHSGVNWGWDIASKKDAVEDLNHPIRLKKNDFMYEFGAGFDIYFEYFKFSPEVKYSLGLRNMLEPSKNVYSNSLKGLNSRVLMLSFTFE